MFGSAGNVRSRWCGSARSTERARRAVAMSDGGNRLGGGVPMGPGDRDALRRCRGNAPFRIAGAVEPDGFWPGSNVACRRVLWRAEVGHEALAWGVTPLTICYEESSWSCLRDDAAGHLAGAGSCPGRPGMMRRAAMIPAGRMGWLAGLGGSAENRSGHGRRWPRACGGPRRPPRGAASGSGAGPCRRGACGNAPGAGGLRSGACLHHCDLAGTDRPADRGGPPGSPPLCAHATEHAFDLLVLGRHGDGGTLHPRLGRVPEAAARASAVSLLLVSGR